MTIDMIVRGVCCPKAGVPGVSDRIRVRSVVGRFLEHSRIYYFANGGNDALYIGSADLRERNLDRRVETLCPIRNRELAAHVRGVVLDSYLRDNDRATMLVQDCYVAVPQPAGEPTISAQQYLRDWYTQQRLAAEDEQARS